MDHVFQAGKSPGHRPQGQHNVLKQRRRRHDEHRQLLRRFAGVEQSDVLKLQRVVAHKYGAGVQDVRIVFALRAGMLDAQQHVGTTLHQRYQGRPQRHQTAAAETPLHRFAVFQQLWIQADAGIDEKNLVIELSDPYQPLLSGLRA